MPNYQPIPTNDVAVFEKLVALNTTIDWTKTGALTPIKDQGQVFMLSNFFMKENLTDFNFLSCYIIRPMWKLLGLFRSLCY